jgi:hypothetical protein
MLCISIRLTDIASFGGVGIEDGEEGWGRPDVLAECQVGKDFFYLNRP